MGRVLALDLGEKRVGVAISDPTHTIAQPLQTIAFKNVKTLISDLRGITHQYQIDKIIVGHPLTMKGSRSRKTEEVEKIFAQLQSGLTVSMELFDERLTTVMANATMHQLNRKPSRERERVDQLAAAHLLQNYLDEEYNAESSRQGKEAHED